MKQLNVAIIGQGRSGRDIHGAFFKSEANTHFKVVAVVDEIEYRRERAKEEYGCDVYASYQELFDRKDIDLVVNSTYSHQHVPVSIDLLNHGFNVVCEKPFAKSYEDGCFAIQAAKKNGKMLNVFQQSRFAPYYTKIREILDSGVLGEIIQISISFSGFARRWDWQTSKAYAGGNVRNTGPHPLDQAMDLMGFPEKVNVFSKLACLNTYGDAEDYAKIVLTAPGAPLVDVEISSCNAYAPYTYVVHCKNGSLRANMQKIEYKYFDPAAAPAHQQILTPLEKEGRYPAYCSEKLEWIEKEEEVTGTAFNSAVYKYYEMIYAHLTEGKPMAITPYQVLTQLKVIDQIHAQNPLTVK
ncbi:MAG: Gfo/Idh/MocA family oxidoreductase [Clostridiales bacterium]|nr:Gfo/Idh/MocA family oxidoreductase [Clostridiales bacterium]